MASKDRMRRYRLRKLLGLKYERFPNDPTPEEIAQRAAEIRETWDEERWKKASENGEAKIEEFFSKFRRR